MSGLAIALLSSMYSKERYLSLLTFSFNIAFAACARLIVFRAEVAGNSIVPVLRINVPKAIFAEMLVLRTPLYIVSGRLRSRNGAIFIMLQH